MHATRPGTGPHPIADILAIVIAADSACQFVAAAAHPGEAVINELARDAAWAWADAREQLAPFNDGSRRPQTHRPPAVESALALYQSLHPLAAVSGNQREMIASGEQLGDGMGVVTDRLAIVAERLDATVVDGVAGGRFMAYAVDLPMREARVVPFLERRRAPGLVTADVDDIAPVRSALRHAATITAALAAAGRTRVDRCNSDRAPSDTYSRSAAVRDATALQPASRPLTQTSAAPATYSWIGHEPAVRRR